MTDRESIKQIVREALQNALAEQQRAPETYFAPWTGVEYEAHPSRQQFNINEASITVGDLIELAESKLCTIEKNKPCDQCGMCRSLGF